MSNPYLYTPNAYHAYQPTPYVDPYINQAQPSPFIPNATLYPSSPYSSAPGTPRRVHFDDELFPDLPPRPRRPSWHAGMMPPMASMELPQSGYSPYLQPAPSYFSNRRHSFGNSTYQSPWSAYNALPGSPWLYPSQPPQFQIHPLLNGESPRPDFFFDLSSPVFSPVRRVGPGQSGPLTMDELRQPATYPPITRLRITCDIIPQWPIELEYNPYESGQLQLPVSAVPITLGDILVAIHRGLHTRISHIDWARLSLSEETAIARAYTKRCRSIPSLSQLEASQGVRRVDYLLDKVRFRGLLRVMGEQGFETMKLVVD